MNEQRNEKRIDELISRTINTEKPQFDVEKWKMSRNSTGLQKL